MIPLLVETFRFVDDHASTDMAFQRGKKIVDRWTKESSWARDGLDDESATRLADLIGGVFDSVQRDVVPDHFDPTVERSYRRFVGSPKNQRAKLSPEGALLKATLETWAQESGALGKVSSADFSKLVKSCVQALEAL